MQKYHFSQQKAAVGELEQSFLDSRQRSTAVGMQEDYVNDQQICLTSVTFIPDELACEIIKQIIKPLSAIHPNHYFYKSSSLHLTIKNVRTISNPPLFNQEEISKVDSLLQKLVPQFSQFEFNVEDVLLLPTSISLMAYSNSELQKLVLSLDKGLQDIGVPDNKKYISETVFWGNITVCRFTSEPSSELIEMVKSMRKLKLGKF